MKTKINLLICLVLCTIALSAQNSSAVKPGETGDKSKMEIFKIWEGKWKGEGTIQQGPGAAKKSNVEETIELKLDGMILVVEGIGKALEGTEQKIVHHAFAVLSYDQNTSSYKFRSYLKDGRSTEAWFKPVGENTYQWGFDVPNGKIRYNISIDAAKKTWTEAGEFSSDGNTWHKFFEMNLQKV